MADAIDPYKILQVDSEAEDEVIQAAYRRLARKYHPDLATAPDAAARMAAINVAWELIGEPPARRAFDQQRVAASPTSARRSDTPPSRDWTSGRSTMGGGYDESMRAAEGFGAAGPPPGRPSGTVLNFGRYAGWSLGEVARTDIEYVEWLDRAPIGRNYGAEIDGILRASGRRRSDDADASDRRGLYRRR